MRPLRHIALCLAALLFLIPSAKAEPSESGQPTSPVVIRSAYFQRQGEGVTASDVLFAFISQESEWPSPLKVSAGVTLKGKQEFWEADGLQTVAERDQETAYLLLVDHSNSMNAVSGTSNVTRFAKELVRRGGSRENISYALACFGAEFQMEQEFTTDTDAFLESVGQIKYGERASDPSKAILAAVDYLNERVRDEGELVNLILITDGIPEETNEDSLALDKVTKQLEGSPSVLVHTFGLSNRNREESAQGMDAMASMGQGVHVTTLDTNALTAARQVTMMVEELYVFRFPMGQRQSGQTMDVGLYFNGTLAASMRIPYLAQAGTAFGVDETPADPSAEGTPSESSSAGGTSDGSPAGDEGEDAQGDSSADGGKNAAAGGTSADGSQSGGGADQKDLPVIWIAGGIAGVIALAGIGFFVLRRGHTDVEPQMRGSSICMVLDVISGECATKERRFYLSDELIIGKSRKCDIVWKDSCMAPQSARVFFSNQTVCIEDIGSFDGVYLGGMRLHNVNRLRSGDEIAIGTVRFRFKF